MRLFHADSQVMKLDLGLGPRQSLSALKHSRVVILVGQLQRRVACRSNDSGIDQADRLASRNAHGAAQGHRRIEHGANGVRQRPPVNNRDGIANIAAASKESCAVRFELQIADRLRVYRQAHGRPRRKFRHPSACGG